MTYLAGMDGGGSKTHCVIGDSQGNILAEGFSSGSNYQSVGETAAERAVRESLGRAMEKLGIAAGDLAFITFGLAGADLEQDYAVLNALCERVCGHRRFQVLTDTWVGLRAGIPANWGIVTVCGTGGSCSGRNGQGREVTLRNLTYEVGSRGGGGELVRAALHHAFRSEERTGKRTKLEEAIPELLGLHTMEELVPMVYTEKPDLAAAEGIPALVCRLADDGDEVCQDLLAGMGAALGEIAGGVARRLEMERVPFEATLVGGLFRSENPLLKDSYTLALHRAAPLARVGIAQDPPAVGAYRLAGESYAARTPRP